MRRVILALGDIINVSGIEILLIAMSGTLFRGFNIFNVKKLLDFNAGDVFSANLMSPTFKSLHPNVLIHFNIKILLK